MQESKDYKLKLELARLLEEKSRRQRQNRISSYYPETGPLRRELYPKHIKFFDKGDSCRSRLMLAANRIGKTEGVGAYESTCHLTGIYPDWWKGQKV